MSGSNPTAEPTVVLSHGEGGRHSRWLLREVIARELGQPTLAVPADAAGFATGLGAALGDGTLVLTTDGYVVTPLFFPGGDIGRLAVFGAVNDLAVVGARPMALSLALIAEEGLPLEVLRRVLRSVAAAAAECGVSIVTGDTKVVPRGAADRLFVTVSGVGVRPAERRLGIDRIRPGDRILVSGPLGDHGVTILAARESLGFEGDLRSDSAPVTGLMTALLATVGESLRFARDPTRGGAAGVLHEISEATGLTAVVEESAVPVSEAVRGACELLGLDPLHIASEGRVLAVVAEEAAEDALRALRAEPLGAGAAVIGSFREGQPAAVLIRGSLGTERLLADPVGSPLPRIC